MKRAIGRQMGPSSVNAGSRSSARTLSGWHVQSEGPSVMSNSAPPTAFSAA